MTEYFIGMHGSFDDEKYKRDFTENISGIEFCNFEEMSEIERIVGIAKKDKFKIGIHFPLCKWNYKFRDPLVLALEETERREAFEAIERELEIAKEIGAKYLLIHFPKPMALDESLKWDICYFPTSEEMMYDSKYPYEEFESNCAEAFEKLSKLSEKTGVTVVLELDFINKYIYEKGLFKNFLDKYKNIRICLDSARLHIQSVIDKDFQLYKFIEDMGPYTYLLHLSNVKVSDRLELRHYPVLPELNTEEGWGDIGEFLRVLSQKRKDYKILFEHRSDLIAYEDLIRSYNWVRSYFE